jgi:nucleotide-binding universal stress UspA family protein
LIIGCPFIVGTKNPLEIRRQSMFKKVLVPLDGSEISEGVLPWVSHVARGLNLPVALLSIVEPGDPAVTHQVTTPGVVRYQSRFPFLSFAADEQYYTGVPAESAREGLPTTPSKYQYDYADHHLQAGDEEEMAQIEEWLRERAAQLEGQGVTVLEETIVTADDKPSQIILQFAEEHGCDLVLMGSHDRNLLEQAFKGSVTSSVIRSSRIPVLAMTPEKQSKPLGGSPMLWGLSVLLDGSAFAESALPYAKSLARSLALEIVLIRWLRMGQVRPAFIGTGSLNQVQEELAEEATEARQYLEAIVNDLQKEGLEARWEIPSSALDSEANELPQKCAGSMIVLASHGRSGLSRWLEGSVAEELLRHSGCPVLIIPSELAEQIRPEKPSI